MEYSSKLISTAIKEITKLPSIGNKTALRLVLHLLKQPEEFTKDISDALIQLRKNIKYCDICNIISDTSDCTCNNLNTDNSIICVVEDTPDVLAIKNTGQYSGMFHILGGRISPIEGIGPDELSIDKLIKRVKDSNNQIKEIILALSATMEGDTTAYYISKLLKNYDIKITTIARGIPVGGELEYADEITLGRSLVGRTVVK